MNSYTIGVDFGSDSVRAVVVSTKDGAEIACSVCRYPRWSRGEYCSPRNNQYRQHPKDYIESMISVIKDMLSGCSPDVVSNIVGISFDTTASTPAITDENGTPLALLDEYSDDPDAMFILWKDHTSIAEAEEINELAHSWSPDYTMYSGGTYSCEWAWSKVLHVLRRNERIRSRAVSWVEHCDWISGLLVGNVAPATIARSRCVAGHKVMWNAEWGGLPSREFAERLDPKLAEMRDTFSNETYTADYRVGYITSEWADILGLPENVAIGIGAIDCHVGAIGAGIRNNVLVKVVGTSTCDIITVPYDAVCGKTVRGICGQVDGSVIPGCVGLEAGQSAFGDVYAWFERLLLWPLRKFVEGSDYTGQLLSELTKEAERIPVTDNDIIACDWFNGRRTPDADPTRKGAIDGLTLATSAPEIFKALVEATAFGSRAITERILEEGIVINEIIAIGGIAAKSPYVMQTMSDVIGLPIKVSKCEQTCAFGAAMFASVVAGVYDSIFEAQNAMSSGFSAEYFPDSSNHEVYNRLYARYCEYYN